MNKPKLIVIAIILMASTFATSAHAGGQPRISMQTAVFYNPTYILVGLDISNQTNSVYNPVAVQCLYPTSMGSVTNHGIVNSITNTAINTPFNINVIGGYTSVEFGFNSAQPQQPGGWLLPQGGKDHLVIMIAAVQPSAGTMRCTLLAGPGEWWSVANTSASITV